MLSCARLLSHSCCRHAHSDLFFLLVIQFFNVLFFSFILTFFAIGFLLSPIHHLHFLACLFHVFHSSYSSNMISRLMPFITLKQQQPQTTPSSGGSLSSLDIPELLQHIFSFLNQRSLRTVILVCRQWLFLNQHHLHREVIWDDSWKHSNQFRTLARLEGAHRLVFRSNQKTSREGTVHLQDLLQSLHGSSGSSPVARLGSAVHSLVGTLSRSQPITGFSSHPLRELVFRLDAFSEEWINQLPMPPTLTILKIDRYWEFRIDIARVILICPLLETLDLSTCGNLVFRGQYTDRGKEVLPARLPLRSLVLRNLCTPQSWLEDLLTITPDLEILKLVEHKNYSIERNTERWDWDRFLTLPPDTLTPSKATLLWRALATPRHFPIPRDRFDHLPQHQGAYFFIL